MEIKDRIDKIKQYFNFFNMTTEASYALVSFPSDRWIVPKDMYDGKVETTRDTKGYYFFTDFNEDPEIIFNAIDEVIEYNKNLEKKTELLKEKMNELKTLFENEELDKLSTMEFSFSDTIKEEPKFTNKSVKKEEVVEAVKEQPEPDKEEEKKKNKPNKVSTIMNEAKKLVSQ